MNQGQLEILLLLSAAAAACAVLGVFLVLRRVALMSDAIGHVLLFGIVLAYFATSDLKSPWLIVGAALSGLATVVLVEVLQRSRLVREDAAIGLVFPALFAAGVILASMYFRQTHLDVDSVLLGNPELATLPRFEFAGYYWGPKALVVMLATLTVDVVFVTVFFKELKLGTFDAGLAATLGFLPGLLHYALMGLVSLTAVTAFDAVGPVLVVAFMVVPAATAYLLTDRLGLMLVLSVALGATGAVIGTRLAFAFGTTTAGMVATALGAQFALAFALAPRRGLLAQALRRWRQRRGFFELMLAVHLFQHEGTPEEAEESRVAGLHHHLRWKPSDVAGVVRRVLRKGWAEERGGRLVLTDAGRAGARSAVGDPV